MEWSGVQCSGVCRIGRLYFCNFETVFVERKKGKGEGIGKGGGRGGRSAGNLGIRCI